MYWLTAILILPYFFIFMRVWRSLQRIKFFNSSGGQIHYISVLIPCKNESQNLPFLLNNLALQDYPPDSFEVIIIDDNSTDRTFEVASDYKKIKNLSVIKNKGRGKKAAIRTGVTFSSGKLILTTDADCKPGGKWLKTIGTFYTDNIPDMIICPVQLENKKGIFYRFQEIEFLSLQGVTAGFANTGNAIMCNGANLSFTKEAYSRHNGNLHDDIPSGDDIFLLHSLKKDPISKVLWLESADALAIAASSTGIKQFFKQRNRWISKSKAYNDRATIIAGLVTFLANITILSLITAAIFKSEFIQVLVFAFIIKAIPDFLILYNTTARYNRKPLMKWFLPSEIIYPFYVLGVCLCALLSEYKTTNSPFQKEI